MRKPRLSPARSILTAAISLLSLAPACTSPDPAEQAVVASPDPTTRLTVYTVNYPLRYLASRIGGDLVRAELPAPPGEDPAFWNPTVDSILAYQAADLILRNGAGYAGWVDRTTLPASRIVDTSAAFAERYLTVEDVVTHTHGPGGEHSHGTIAFTTWLDPTLAVEQARAVLDAMVRLRPSEEEALRAGFASLEGDLADLDRDLGEAFAADPRRPLLASHPVYQYLAHRYDLALRSVHFEPDEPPEDGEWRKLERILEEHPASVMLWEAEPLPETAGRLRELGIGSIVFDPCGGNPEDGDYLSVMRRNLESLRSIF